MKKFFYLILLLPTLLIISGCTKKDTKESNMEIMNTEDKNQAQATLSPKLQVPEMQIDSKRQYLAVLNTSAGKLTITLYADKTPVTVNNFVHLAKNKFYDSTIFHRVISGFMIQGGDPRGDGTGGPGYRFDDEPFEEEYEKGIVAMANSGPNTNGSQFFIMHTDYPLPKDYVIFGKVSEGIEVVDKIAEAPVTQNSTGEMSKPINPVTIDSVEIIEK